jgi:PAS domain S-box-containing protein
MSRPSPPPPADGARRPPWGVSGALATAAAALAFEVWAQWQSSATAGARPSAAAELVERLGLLFLTFTLILLGVRDLRSRWVVRDLRRDAAAQQSAAAERREAAERAREVAEESFRRLFRRNPAATYISTADGRLLDCNDSFLRLLGFADREEALATPTHSLYTLASFTPDQHQLLHALRHSGHLDNLETKLRRRNGEIITVLESISWERRADGVEILEGIALDITPRQEAESALRRSEARWRALLSLAPVGVVETTAAGDYVYVNPAWCRMSGLPPEEAQGHGWLAAVHPDERQRVAAEWAAAAAAGVRHHTEHRFARRHEAVWVAVDSTPLYNDRDRRVGYIRIVADINENRLAAEALRESELRYRSIFENGLGFLCTHDLDGRLLSITPAAAGALGFTPEELTGRSLAGVLAPSVRDGFATYLESIRRGERSDGLMRLVTRQGEERFWMYRNVLHSPLAGPPYVLGFAFDITESRRARNDLAASERRFRQFLEASGDMIQSLNAEGTLNYVNRRWREVLGYTEEEVRTLRMPDFVAPWEIEHCVSMLARLEAGQGLPTVETVFLASDGREVEVQGTISASFEDGRFVSCQGFFRDVGRSRRLEEQRRAYLGQIQHQNLELELHRKQAVHANRLKSEFLATMSHELRTPLNAIVGFSELLADDTLHPLTEQQSFHLTFVRRAAEHLLRLIDDVLDLSKIEAGRFKLSPEVLRIADLLPEVLSTLGPLAAQKGIALHSQVPDDLPVFADRLHFKQILFNLLSNAVKFTPSGGTVTVHAASVGASSLLSIANTGLPIDPAEHETIFDEFQQAARGGGESRGGTGLGLAIVRRLVEHHGGKVWVESSPDTETTFVVLLPSRQEPRAAAPLAPPSLPRAQAATGGVLLVSDDLAARRHWSELLELERYRVHAVACDVDDGGEVRSLVASGEAQLMILDLASTGERGWRLLRERLRELAPAARSPTLVLALVAEAGSQRAAFLAGAHGCLVLPVDDGLLVKLCRRRLEPFDLPRVVLIVEPDEERQRLLAEAVLAAGFRPVAVPTGRDALLTAGSIHPHAIVLDLQLPELDGYQTIVRLRSNPDTAQIPILVLAQKGEDAVETQLFTGPTRLLWLPADDWQDTVQIEIRRTVDAERWLASA